MDNYIFNIFNSVCIVWNVRVKKFLFSKKKEGRQLYSSKTASELVGIVKVVIIMTVNSYQKKFTKNSLEISAR